MWTHLKCMSFDGFFPNEYIQGWGLFCGAWITPLSTYTRGPHWFWLGHGYEVAWVVLCTVGLVLSECSLFGFFPWTQPLPLWEAHPGHGRRQLQRMGGAALSPASFQVSSQVQFASRQVSCPWSESSKLLSCLAWAQAQIWNHDQINKFVLFPENGGYVVVDKQNELNKSSFV